MLEAYPPQSPGRLISLGLIVGLILLDALILVLLLSLSITLLSFFLGLFLLASIPAILLLTVLITSLSSVRYYVEDYVLIIEWGSLRQVIGFGQIQAIYLGDELNEVLRFRGLRWPGLMFGRGQLFVEKSESVEAPISDEEPATLPTFFYATQPLAQQLLISTGSKAYAISPANPADFKVCLEALRPEEDADQLPLDLSSDLGILGWDIWHDRVVQICLGLAVLLNGLLFAYLSFIVGRLPSEVALHFDEFGVVDRFGSPAGLFVLPLVGLIAWVAAGTLGWFFYQVRGEKPIGYIVWGTIVIIELATWIALAGLLSNA
jgi:hypothetical protein